MTTLNLTLVALGAFAIVIAGIPAVMKMCARWGIYDQPGPLKIHAKPMPRLGGVALALGLAISVGAAGPIAGFDPWPLLACIAILALVGVTDDVRGTSPFTRLAVQLAVGIYLGASGYAIALTNSSIANVLIVAAVVVTFINAFNFLDGSDGVAACVTLATALTFIATGAASLSPLLGASAWALAGCSAAFLLFNWPPARIFLGDSGSTVIGLVVAVLTLEYVRCLPSYAHPGVLLFPFAVAAVPLADAAFAIARRSTHRTAPTSGDQSTFLRLVGPTRHDQPQHRARGSLLKRILRRGRVDRYEIQRQRVSRRAGRVRRRTDRRRRVARLVHNSIRGNSATRDALEQKRAHTRARQPTRPTALSRPQT